MYVDYLERWAWTVDSKGRKGNRTEIHDDEEREAAENNLALWLDAFDPIPASAFVPAPLNQIRTLRLLP